MRVLALDPGERVGWARADIADDGEWSDLRHGITPLKDMALAVHAATVLADLDAREPVGYDVVVMEDFRLSPMGAKHLIGSSFPTVQFIGMVRLCCWLSNTKLVTQGASIKDTADKSMKALRPELWETVSRPIRHDDGHDQDALRHLWYYTFKQFDVRQEAA